jgi:hypothetical protein
MRWLSGKGFICKDNVRISRQEYSSGRLFKRCVNKICSVAKILGGGFGLLVVNLVVAHC